MTFLFESWVFLPEKAFQFVIFLNSFALCFLLPSVTLPLLAKLQLAGFVVYPLLTQLFFLRLVTYAVVGRLLQNKFAMSVIDVKAQQIVVDALACEPKNAQKIVLCHTPSKLRAGSDMFLSTQDRLQELFASSPDSTVAVFPNTNFVRRLCKRFQGETFSVELVFACHASSDPNDLVLELLGKFSVDFNFI